MIVFEEDSKMFIGKRHKRGACGRRRSLACLYTDTLQNMKYKMLANIIRRETADRKKSVTFLPIPVCEERACGGVAAACFWARGVVCALCEEGKFVFVDAPSCAVVLHGVAMVAIWLQ